MSIRDEAKKREAQRRADAKRAGKRARAWTAMVYPESALDDWMDKLANQLVEAMVSPLHDKDVWTKEDEAENEEHVAGTLKKAHWHVVLSFKNPTTYETAKEIFEFIGAVVPPEHKSKVKDFKQMARYLCHLDQPKKHRYETTDVVTFGAIDYQSLVMAGCDEDDMLDEMMQYIDDNCIVSFRQFCVYVRTERPEWRVLVYHQYAAIISRYIKSLEWEIERGISYERFPSHESAVCSSVSPMFPMEMEEQVEHNEKPTETTSTSTTSTTSTEMSTTPTTPTTPTEMSTTPTEMSTTPTENTTDFEIICCRNCGSVDLQKNGKTKAGSQVWRCKSCGKRFVFMVQGNSQEWGENEVRALRPTLGSSKFHTPYSK